MSTDTITDYCGLWNVAAEEYFAYHSAYSGSMLKVLNESSRRFHGMYISNEIPSDPPTPAMRLGSLKHIAVLEPDRWSDFVEIAPESVLSSNGSRNTNAYRQWAADRPGKILAKQGELDIVKGMVDAIHANEVARNALHCAGPCEQALRWNDEFFGLPMKGRLDKIALNGRVIVDLKKCANNSPHGFAKACSDYDYHIQAAIYCDGFEQVFGFTPDAFLHVTVSDDPPHKVATYKLHEDDIQQGRLEYRALLERLARHLETGDWRAPEELEVNDIRLLAWRRREIN